MVDTKQQSLLIIYNIHTYTKIRYFLMTHMRYGQKKVKPHKEPPMLANLFIRHLTNFLTYLYYFNIILGTTKL